MAVDKQVSLSIVKSELEKSQADAGRYAWEISEINECTVSFRVKMISPLDKEIFIISFRCDNYREWPPLIDFIDPLSGQEGVKNAYPLSSDGFFHSNVLICHPCSRKAYGDLKGPHADWGLATWESNSKTGALKNIWAILSAIYGRISQSEIYKGRMK